jgi:hypothetical protein
MMRDEDEHPAAPEQIEHGFDEGAGKRPGPPSKRRVGRFSEGIEHEPEAPLRRALAFSSGQRFGPPWAEPPITHAPPTRCVSS